MADSSDTGRPKGPSEDARDREERFQLAVTGANDGIWDWDLMTNVLYFSNRLKAIVGHEDLDNEAEAGQWMRRIHPDDAPKVAKAIGRLVSGQRGDHFENEHRLRHKDGTYKWVLLRGLLVRDAEGKPARMAGSLTDITERKRIEQVLRDSEERYRQLVEDLNDVIFTLDADGRLTYISPVIEQLSGYTPTEITGRSFLSFIHPDDLEAALLSFQRTLGGELEPFDFRVTAKDGAVRWVRTSSRPAADDGVLMGLRGVLTDITDRKRAEAALVENERRFRALVEHSSDLVSVIDRDGTFTYFSPSLTAILGYQPEEIVGLPALTLVHPDDHALAAENFADLVKRPPGASIMGASRCRHKDGSWRWLEAIGTNLLTEPGFEAIIVNSRDVTDRMHAEEELRQSEERFRKIFEEGPLGMAMMSPDYGFFAVNNQYCRIVGYTAEELQANKVEDITHPDDRQATRLLAEHVFSGNIPDNRLEKRYIRKDGAIVWANLTVSVIRDPQGAPLYGIGMVEDITDRKRAESEAQERLAELAHVLRVATVNEMAAMLAHELNQPLAAIINYARGCVLRLEAGPVPPEQLLRAQADIVDEALRAAAVIRRLRQFLRKEPPRCETLDLNDVVQGVVGLLEVEAHTHDVAVRLDLSPDLPPVHADRIQIEQVVLNLIRNGFEAMDGAARRRELHLRTRLAAPDLVEVAVSDTGPGVSATMADQVFTPFFTTKPGGLGMGLPISRLIVEAHGGRLWATANTDRGTRFQFTLPAASDRDGARSAEHGARNTEHGR